ncbi:MAG: hypothetical protein ACRD9L_26780 [Bryobacteraceae bacterium]
MRRGTNLALILFMTSIHACQLTGTNSFDYMTEAAPRAGTCDQARGVYALEIP